MIALMLTTLAILAVIGMFMAFHAGHDQGYEIGHQDGFGHAMGWHLPAIDDEPDTFESEVDDLLRDYQKAALAYAEETEQSATEGHHYAS